MINLESQGQNGEKTRTVNMTWHLAQKSDDEGEYFEAQLEQSEARLHARTAEDLQQKINDFERDYWQMFQSLHRSLGLGHLH
jgi:hypothetical protein